MPECGASMPSIVMLAMRVTEASLSRFLSVKPHAFGGVGEAAEGVELLQDERGDLQEHADSSRDSLGAG